MIAESSDLKSYHRPDIQGLRGVAVLLVVIYHTGIALPGGFIGVDMFFVISGFVITQVLMREFEETGTIRLRNFYARRARRLIPALSLMVVFTLLISLVAMSPFGEQQQIIKTAVASVFFAGNIHLFATNTYDALKNNPLRHLWSLGVEEQFYWVYPLFFVGVLRASRNIFYKKRLVAVLTVFAIISFGICVLLTYGFEFGYTKGSALSFRFGILSKIGFQPGGGWPTRFAFFGAPARFWEILVGAVLAVCANNFDVKSKFGSRVLVGVGVGSISWATFMFSPVSKFPGFIALFPVASTALLILFGRQLRVCNDFLSSKQLVYFGDISYSLYLWHWPIIVFARIVWPATLGVSVIAAGLSFIPAGLSYRFVEARLRSKPTEEKKYGKSILSVVAIIPLVFSFCFQKAANTGLGITGIEWRSTNAAHTIAKQSGGGCDEYPSDFLMLCKVGVKTPTFSVFLFGDSNAKAASDGVQDAVLTLGGSLTIATSSGCPFLISSPSRSCDEFNVKRFDAVKKYKPDAVIIVNQQSDYLGNSNFSPWNTPKNMILSLSETLDLLNKFKVPAIVQGEIPLCDFSISLISKVYSKRQNCLNNFDSQRDHLWLLKSTKEVTSQVSNHLFFDPRPIICPEQLCKPFNNGKMVFVDRDHLSHSGSKLLTPVFIEALTKILKVK
ncbi:MAG: acyltransferase family protein [Actinomycetota bacterium]